MINIFTHSISINLRQTLINITQDIKNDVESSKIKNGIVLVYCPHTTAGITINENTDPDVVIDFIYGFEKTHPSYDSNYRHFEGNSHSHIKASIMGASQSFILNDGKLLLGQWQAIYFCEFDGPRNRQFHVKILEG